jgi:hypothetical protein
MEVVPEYHLYGEQQPPKQVHPKLWYRNPENQNIIIFCAKFIYTLCLFTILYICFAVKASSQQQYEATLLIDGFSLTLPPYTHVYLIIHILIKLLDLSNAFLQYFQLYHDDQF